MHLILAYDIEEKRVNRVRKYVRRYLPRVQNSVFEGDLSEAKLERLRVGLTRIIDPAADSVLIWILRDAKWVERQTLGYEKLPVNNIL